MCLLGGTLWSGVGRAQTGPATLQVVITDETGAYVEGLKAGDFVVSVDKVKLPVQAVQMKSDAAPMDISLVLETSVIAGQMADSLLDITQLFVKHLRSGDQMGLVSFDSSASLVQDFTTSHESLLTSAHGLKYGNGAALLDAIYATADGGYANSTAQRVMVVVSSGIDTGSRVALKDLAPVLKKHHIVLYAISLGRRGFYGGGASEIFDKLTVATGGHAFYPRRAPDIGGIVNQIMGGTAGREYYELSVDAPALPLDLAQSKLRVQIDRGLKEDKNLEITARFANR